MGRPRDPAQLARDRRRVADLYLKGWIQADIAEEVGLNQGTVSRDLKALHKEWLASALVDIDEAKSRELAKIDKLEREYWQAWERSQEDAETVTKKATETGGVERKEGAIVTKGQAGDPRFLAGVQWCIERRCKILGIDAPEKKEHSGPGGGPINLQSSGSLTIYEYGTDTDSGA
jgi:hypothetical protein